MKSIERLSSDCANDKLPYYSPTFKRRTAASYFLDYPDNGGSPKKDKKWSFGSLFRRKKKDNNNSDNNSSSDDDAQKKKLKKKKKAEKKSKLKSLVAFDHIVLKNNGNGYCEDVGILSDPTGGFGSYSGRPLPKIPTPVSDVGSRLSSSNNIQLSRQSLESSDSVSKQNRKGRAKARAELRRGHMKGDSSSDDESQLSHFKSDDSLRNHKDLPGSRRSRAARTERYIRRLSKDEEKILNKEAQLLRAYKSDAENHYEKSPVLLHPRIKYSNSDPFPNLMMGLSTIPPREQSHNNSNKTKLYANNKLKQTKHSAVNLEVPNVNNNHRSYSCDADIHKSPSPETPENVIHAQLALTKPQGRNNISLIELSRLDKHPPPPPPRDPRRLLPKQDNRPLSFNFDKDAQQRTRHQPIKSKSLNLHPGYRLSNSEDCISNMTPSNVQLVPRPSSVTPSRKQDEFQYYMDKKPRSRKPILIQDGASSENTRNAQNFWKQKDRANSPQIFTSQTHVRTNIFLPSVLKQDMERDSSPFQPIDFPNNNNNIANSNLAQPPVANSPTLNKTGFNYRTASPISDQKISYCTSPIANNKLIINKRTSSPVPKNALPNNSHNAPFAHAKINPASKSIIGGKPNNPTAASAKSNANIEKTFSDNNRIIGEENIVKERKSSNLEDALDELEAIYKSLHLGDEDLLERAEQREKSIIATQKLAKTKGENYPGWSMSYEPFDNKKYISDRKTDDMAFRKLNANGNNNKKPNNVPLQSSVSYLLATPSELDDNGTGIRSIVNDDEPDVTLDDVVFRNLKHANNTLKIQDPQPPFGIPLGPIAPSANSDYLHAIPDELPKTNAKIPDIVKDDLAYRNLRKDHLKDPALPPLNKYDFLNNNNNNFGDTRKKRAVRSLSANIYNLMHTTFDDGTNGLFGNDDRLFDSNAGMYVYNKAIDVKKTIKEPPVENAIKKNDNLSDIADAMEIARQILKEKEEKLCNRTFLSDTDTRRMNRHHFARRPFISLPNSEKVAPKPIDHDNSLDDLINALAAEARETTEKLTSEINKSSELNKIASTVQSRDDSKQFALNKSKSFDTYALKNNHSQTSEEFILDLSKEIDKIQFEECNDIPHKAAEEFTKCDAPLTKPNSGLNSPKEVYDVDKKLSDIEAASDRAKLCGKLLDSCAVSEPLQLEEVQHIESVANVVITSKPVDVDEAVRSEEKLEKMDSSTTSATSSTTTAAEEDEHDYVNCNAEAEIERNIPFIDGDCTRNESTNVTCKSPFEENKAKLIADFQELNNFDEEMMMGDGNKSKDNEEGVA